MSPARGSSRKEPVRQVEAAAEAIAAAMGSLPLQNTPTMRAVRRAYSQEIKLWSAEQVLELAEALRLRPGLRWIGYELVRFHPRAFRSLGAARWSRPRESPRSKH